VVATNDVEEVVAIDADCVLYMARTCDFDEVCRLLASGRNVVTTRGEFHRPESMDPAVRARVEAACHDGGTSIHSTGSSPGFITEAVPLVLTSILRRLDHLAIEESANLSKRDSPGLLFEVMGFGRPPGKVDQGRADHLRDSFGPSLQAFADAISMPLDGLEARGEVATARQATEIAAGTLEKGTVAGQRTTISGMRGGKELIRFRATWYCTTDLDASWDLQETGWHVRVDGDTPLDVSLPFPFSLEEMAERSPGYTAHRAVNAVRVVCEAAPGIRTTVELPQIIADLG
jgi:4-hydroxy-tetrahydrodipicolinate reductase